MNWHGGFQFFTALVCAPHDVLPMLDATRDRMMYFLCSLRLARTHTATEVCFSCEERPDVGGQRRTQLSSCTLDTPRCLVVLQCQLRALANAIAMAVHGAATLHEVSLETIRVVKGI